MGDDLSTIIFVFEGTRHSSHLALAKNMTLEIEKNLSSKTGQRSFNLNPGMVDNQSMRLASHKPSPLRYKLQNIWVEEQMKLNEGKLEPLQNVFQEYVMGKRLEKMQRLANECVSFSFCDNFDETSVLRITDNLVKNHSIVKRVQRFFTK
jgi:hypothetical protein